MHLLALIERASLLFGHVGEWVKLVGPPERVLARVGLNLLPLYSWWLLLLLLLLWLLSRLLLLLSSRLLGKFFFNQKFFDSFWIFPALGPEPGEAWWTKISHEGITTSLQKQK